MVFKFGHGSLEQYLNIWSWCLRVVSRLYQLLVTLPVFVRSQEALKAANFAFFMYCVQDVMQGIQLMHFTFEHIVPEDSI